MDFGQYNAYLKEWGIDQDPAIIDSRFHVRFAHLPPEYPEGKVLGLYYDQAHDDPLISRLWAPAYASKETVAHETLHRLGDYYFGDMSEDFVERNFKGFLRGGVRMMTDKLPGYGNSGVALQTRPKSDAERALSHYGITYDRYIENPGMYPLPIRGTGLGPAMAKVGYFTQIDVIFAPPNATTGSTVPFSVQFHNIDNEAHNVQLFVTVNGATVISKNFLIEPGVNNFASGAFVMPASNAIINAEVYLWGENYPDSTDSYTVFMGQPTQITGRLVAVRVKQNGQPVNSVLPGTKFDLEVAYFANNPSGGRWSIALLLTSTNSVIHGIMYDSTSIFGGNSLGAQDGTIYKTFSNLSMPATGAVQLKVEMYVNPSFNESSGPPGTGWTQSDLRTVNLSVPNLPNEYTIPPEYTLGTHMVYPYALNYRGYYQTAVVGFTVPLTVVPGVSWLVEQAIQKFVTVCLENTTNPLELYVYSSPGGAWSTNYLLKIVVAAPSARTGPAMLAPLIAVIIILGLVAAIGIIATIFVHQFRNDSSYDKEESSKGGTTTNDVTDTGKPGTVLANTSGAIIPVTSIGGGSVVDSDTGVKIVTVPANGTAAVGPGQTYVDGGGGFSYTIPGGTSYYESYEKEHKEESGTQFTDAVKYVAIAGGIVVVGLVAIAAFQALGKREVYPVRIRA